MWVGGRLSLRKYLLQVEGKDIGCPPCSTKDYVLEWAILPIVDTIGVMEEGCLYCHSYCYDKDCKVQVILDED